MTVDDLRVLIVARCGMAVAVVGTIDIEGTEAWVWFDQTDLYDGVDDEVHRFIVKNPPSTVIRNCDEDLAVLDRHRERDMSLCVACNLFWPCRDAQSVARRYGKELT